MASHPPSTTKRYQALDLWRGVICLFVVLEHAVVALWQGSSYGDEDATPLRRLIVAPFQTNWGTPLFFVISGYCIASSIESSRRKKTAPMIFLARRFWRVFPPYWVALTGFVAMVMALDAVGLGIVHASPYALGLSSPQELTFSQWVGNLTLTETWRPIFAGSEGNVFTRVAWSLCYQEQFYLICFLALLFTRTSLFRVLGFATLGICGVRLAASDIGLIHKIDGTFPVLWHQFAIGLVAYWLLNAEASRVAKRSAIAGLALLVGLATWYDDSRTAVSALFGLGLVGFRRWDDAWARRRFLEPLRKMGRCSYSIYLAHLPVIILVAGGLGELGITGFWTRAAVMVPASSALAVLAGLAFYRVVESRFLELPKFRPTSRPTPSPMPLPSPCLVPVRVAA